MDPASDYGYANYAGIMPPGGATLEQAASEKRYLMKPPTDGKGLLHLRFTRRRKEKLIFDAEDGGMTVYIACRYENQKGEVGQRGPVVSTIIHRGNANLQRSLTGLRLSPKEGGGAYGAERKRRYLLNKHHDGYAVRA